MIRVWTWNSGRKWIQSETRRGRYQAIKRKNGVLFDAKCLSDIAIRLLSSDNRRYRNDPVLKSRPERNPYLLVACSLRPECASNATLRRSNLPVHMLLSDPRIGNVCSVNYCAPIHGLRHWDPTDSLTAAVIHHKPADSALSSKD
jgi:hypothetical protein